MKGQGRVGNYALPYLQVEGAFLKQNDCIEAMKEIFLLHEEVTFPAQCTGWSTTFSDSRSSNSPSKIGCSPLNSTTA